MRWRDALLVGFVVTFMQGVIASFAIPFGGLGVFLAAGLVLAACPCWVCVEARAIGCRPREGYLPGHGRERPKVRVAPDVHSDQS